MIGEIIAIFAVLTFVGSNVIFRKTEFESSPIFINLFRTTIGTITFIFLSIFLNLINLIFLLPLGVWFLLCLSFLFGQVIGDTAYFSAQKELGTTIALAVSMTFPIFTFIFSLIFLKRPFELHMLLSLLLVGLGIIIIGKNKVNSNSNQIKLEDCPKVWQKKSLKEFLGNASFKAIVAGLIASLGWASGLVIIDYTTNLIDDLLNTSEMSSVIGNVIRFPFAVFILLLMYIRESHKFKVIKPRIKKSKSLKTYMLLLIGSILGSSIGAFLYTEAARIAGANIMSLIATASPLFALPLTYWINKEKITKQGFIGVILTILGVVIIII